MLIMGYNIIADFFNLINVPLFQGAAVLMAAAFIAWEIPRTIKIIDEEYTKGLYQEGTRVADILLFLLGLSSALYLFLSGRIYDMVTFLKTPGITSFFLILMSVVPLIILLGFFKRLFSRTGEQESMTVYLVHGLLDLMHTLFFCALATIIIPLLGMLIMGR